MYRLSPIQKHTWQLQRTISETAYASQTRLHITGPLDPPRLEAALDQVCAQNEILRTGFEFPPGMTIPLQVIQDDGSIDLGAKSESGAFDLNQPPLIHAALKRLSADQHELAVSMPALIADAATLDLFVKQLAAAYAGKLETDEETLQYADLSEWLNETLDEDPAEGERWYNQIISAPIIVRLPFERIPDDMSHFEPQQVSRRLDGASLAALEGLIAAQKTTPETFFLAAFQALINRLSGQSEFVLGLGCHGRTYSELEDAMGPFSRSLPFYSTVDASHTISELLAGLSERVLEAFDHQEYFSWDVAAGAGGDSPLPFFALNYEYTTALKEYSAGETRFVETERSAITDRFNLKLTCTPSGTGLELTFLYDAILFDSEQIERFAGYYLELLSNLAADPTQAIGAYPLPGVQEAEQLFAFNATSSAQIADTTITAMFAAQAARRPEALAVIFRGQALSYGELDTRADQVAAALHTLGVGPGHFAGLYIDNSPEMFVGMLGILKSGAAYLPLDPEYPADRIAFMLEDTGAAVVLTRASHQTGLTAIAPRTPQLVLDAEIPAGTKPKGPTGRDHAYIIYTSGSTGKPKGVPVTHANLVHSTAARHEYYDRPAERYLLLSSFSFDSSVAGIFWALTDGGALVLPESGMARDPRYVAGLVRDEAATHTLALPSLYNLLLDEDPLALSSLQVVIVAGEACPRSLVDKHVETLPKTLLFNEYGPTEGTVWASVFDFREPAHEFVSIGRPIPGAQIFILNEQRQLAPLGVAGELCIGGPGVTNGYLNRPEETAERFIENPFGAGTLYRTGDLARWMPDGNLEFLGRLDHQVKIRGYRVELGEIEAVLVQHPGVREAAAIVREDTPGDQRLVAYVAAAPGKSLADELREHLGRDLPPYMVPGIFVQLDKLPQTPNGKVDRNRLPAPDRARRDTGTAFAPPDGAVEELLAGIWSEVLGLEKVGRNDNFFELGGHSILVTQLVARIREALPVELPLRTMFDQPTLAGLAATLLASERRAEIERTAQLTMQVARMSEDDLDKMSE